MCRVLAFSAEKDVPLGVFVEALKVLAMHGRLPKGVKSQKGHGDGWGLVGITSAGEVFTYRSLFAVYADSVSDAFYNVKVKSAILHVRLASKSVPIGLAETHPFVLTLDHDSEKVTLAVFHNGGMGNEAYKRAIKTAKGIFESLGAKNSPLPQTLSDTEAMASLLLGFYAEEKRKSEENPLERALLGLRKWAQEAEDEGLRFQGLVVVATDMRKIGGLRFYHKDSEADYYTLFEVTGKISSVPVKVLSSQVEPLRGMGLSITSTRPLERGEVVTL